MVCLEFSQQGNQQFVILMIIGKDPGISRHLLGQRISLSSLIFQDQCLNTIELIWQKKRLLRS